MSSAPESVSVDPSLVTGFQAAGVPEQPAPGFGEYWAKPPTKRRNKQGEYDISTPPALIDLRSNYVSVLTTGENRHPDEDALIEHYARQLAAKKEGTYNPLEDAPVILRDLLPTIFVVVNKTFTEHEVVLGGGNKVIQDYVQSLAKQIDFDIIPVMCGRPIVLPIHPNVPAQHRDPIFNAQMQSFYKRHDQGAADMLKRIVTAREENEKKLEEQKKQEEETLARRKAEEVAAKVLEEDDADEPPESTPQRWADIKDLGSDSDSEKEEDDDGGGWTEVNSKKAKQPQKARKVAGGRRGRGRGK